MGDASRALNQLDEAIPEYMAALAMDRCSAAAWAALGQTALQGGRPMEATRALQLATRISPKHYPAYAALGQALEHLGQTERASIAYAQALSIKPDYPPATDGLARVAGALNR
jgi:predicted Zn-dependent protease